jgi:hypothetical protein
VKPVINSSDRRAAATGIAVTKAGLVFGPKYESAAATCATFTMGIDNLRGKKGGAPELRQFELTRADTT